MGFVGILCVNCCVHGTGFPGGECYTEETHTKSQTHRVYEVRRIDNREKFIVVGNGNSLNL